MGKTRNTRKGMGIVLLIMLMAVATSYAWWTPYDNQNMRCTYSIENATNISISANCTIGPRMIIYPNATTMLFESEVTTHFTNNVTFGQYTVLSTNHRHCLDGATCGHFIFYNGTHTVIE